MSPLMLLLVPESVPAGLVVPPKWLAVQMSLGSPLPDFTNLPHPDNVARKLAVESLVKLEQRRNISPMSPCMLSVLPSSVPAKMIVAPAYAFEPITVSVPLPSLMSAPPPLMRPEC